MSWFKKLIPTRARTDAIQKKAVPEGVWDKCPSCTSVLYTGELDRQCYVCPKCQFHIRLTARQRIRYLCDENSFEEFATDIKPIDHLNFRDSKKYKDRLYQAQKQTGENDALIIGRARIQQLPLVIALFEFKFMGGSMGTVVGEKFARAIDVAIEDRLPFICVTASGGARMQEGLLSLMQMAKCTAAIAQLQQQHLPYLCLLTDPTMGGVAASLAMLGDVLVAEPKAMIGFAGARVIAETVREQLPDGFQQSEYLLDHGAIDAIVDRREHRAFLSRMLRKLCHLPLAE